MMARRDRDGHGTDCTYRNPNGSNPGIDCDIDFSRAQAEFTVCGSLFPCV